MSFGDEAMPEEERAFSEADAAEEAADAAAAAAAASAAASHGQGHPHGNGSGSGPGDQAAPSGAPAEEADPKELLARERDEYLLALQRTQADFENYRKRVGAPAGRAVGAARRATSSTSCCPCSTRSTWPRPT